MKTKMRTGAALLRVVLLGTGLALSACGDGNGSAGEAMEEIQDEAEDAKKEVEDEIDDHT